MEPGGVRMEKFSSEAFRRNRVVRDCYDAIVELFTRYPLRKITVQMIADAANISRFTFYQYFGSKYELIRYVFVRDTLDAEIFRTEDEASFLAAVTAYFRTLAGKRAFYQKAIAEEDENFRDFFVNFAMQLSEQNIEAHCGRERFHTDGYAESLVICAGGLAYFTFGWLRTRCTGYTPEEMAQVLLRNIPANLSFSR